jgi:hypothetical protein
VGDRRSQHTGLDLLGSFGQGFIAPSFPSFSVLTNRCARVCACACMIDASAMWARLRAPLSSSDCSGSSSLSLVARCAVCVCACHHITHCTGVCGQARLRRQRQPRARGVRSGEHIRVRVCALTARVCSCVIAPPQLVLRIVPVVRQSDAIGTR